MVIESTINDNWGTLEAEVRIFGETEIVNFIEKKVRKFRKDDDYLVFDKGKGKKTYTILSDNLKRSIWEIKGIGYPSPLLRDVPEGVKAGKVFIEIDSQGKVSNWSKGSKMEQSSTNEIDFVHAQFLRDKEREIGEENNYLRNNPHFPLEDNVLDQRSKRLESDLKQKEKEAEEARKRLEEHEQQKKLESKQEHYPFGWK